MLLHVITFNQVKKGDYLIVKSPATKAVEDLIPFTKIKAISKIAGKVNYFTFSLLAEQEAAT